MTLYTLFGQADHGILAVDSGTYTMGVQFSVMAAGTLNAIWFYSPGGVAILPQTIYLYKVSDQSLVASQAASWSGAAGSGWVRAPWTSPPVLAANTQYKACVSQNSGQNWYSITSHYWDTGTGQNGITSGPLTAPNNAGAAQGQDTFSTTIPTYPATSFNASNYWMDPEVSVIAAAVPLVGGGRSMIKQRLLYADL